MTKVQILTASIAVFALGVTVAGSASATLWLAPFTRESLLEEEPASFHGTLTLEHSGGATGSWSITCNGLLIGTVGPGALDLITEVTNLSGTEKNLVSCTVLRQEVSLFKCVSNVGELVIAHAVELPWHTLLELSGSKTLDRLLHYKWRILCPSGLTGECEGEELTEFTGNGTNGAIFEAKKFLSSSKCTDGSSTSVGLDEVLGFIIS